MRLDIVKIVWWDAACESGNLSLVEAKDIHPIRRESVGFLICSNEEKVIISFGSVGDIDKGGICYQDTLVVPKGDVEKITILTDGDIEL